MASLHEVSTAISEEFQLQEVKEYLNQADPTKIKALNTKLGELAKLLPIGKPQLEQGDRVPKYLTKQSVAEDEPQQGHAAQAEQFEVLSAELQQYEMIYQLQSKIIGVLSTHQLNLSGAIEKYRQQVLGKIETSLIQENSTNPAQLVQEGEDEATLGKRSAVRWLKEVTVRSEGNKAPKSEKGVQVCTSQPELALGLGLVSQDPFTSVCRQSKNTIQVNPSSSLESLRAGVAPENKETLDEFAIRKQISEVLRLVSFARGSQLDRSSDPMSSNKKPAQAHGHLQNQITGSASSRHP